MANPIRKTVKRTARIKALAKDAAPPVQSLAQRSEARSQRLLELQRKHDGSRRLFAVGSLAREFHDTFGVDLQSFLHPVLGFDVIKFDELIIETPDNASTEDTVKCQYGPDGLKLVLRIMGLQRPMDALQVFTPDMLRAGTVDS